MSICAMLALLWWRLNPPDEARKLRHPQELPPPVSAAPVVARLRERADPPPRADGESLWGAARPGEVGSDDGDDSELAAAAEQDEKPAKRKFKRTR